MPLKKHGRIIALGLAVAFSGACAETGSRMERADAVPAQQNQALKTLTGDELRATVIGKTVRGSSGNGSRFAVYKAPDGTQKLAWSRGGRTGFDWGNWRIEGDTLCSRFAQVRGGEASCTKTAKDGDKFVTVLANGEIDGTFIVENGDTTSRAP